MQALADLRVIDFSTGIAGAYATKLLADAGADVVKVEPGDGDPLRGWSHGDDLAAGESGALFQFLAAGKRSVVGAPGDPAVARLVRGAGLVVESFAPEAFDAEALAAAEPGLVVLSITPWGRSGPWRSRPWSELTIQAESGSLGTRGLPGREPFQAGGRITQWVAGTFAGVAALAAVRRARRTGQAEHVDFSLLELMTTVGTNYMDLAFRLLGLAEPPGAPWSIETPSIEPTADGWVGFCTNSRQQVSDFMLLIERPELRDDEGLAQVHGRVARLSEWQEAVHAFTRRHTTAEILERAALLRIPAAPVLDGEGVLRHEHLVERAVFRPDASGRFLCPRPPYRLGDRDAAPMRPAPRLGQHTGCIEQGPGRAHTRSEPAPDALPLAGVRILDMTAWWAGPSATHMLAALGADVVHLESTTRLDGMRMTGGMLAGRVADWWEASAFFQAANANKRGLTLDLSTEPGRELCRRVAACCDAVVENFTPRVLESFGLHWEALHALNPRTILVRMPAFGLTGSWRDRTGFAQTMEQMSGLAWVTGHPDDQPRIQRGPCDPNAGMHAAFAFLVALAERERTGQGQHVECTMIEGALNAAAEGVLEFTAYGRRLGRLGNRSAEAAPQGLYPCLGSRPGRERWLALSVVDDRAWRALVDELGSPGWAREPGLSTRAGRLARHDDVDRRLRRHLAERSVESWVEALVVRGVPAAPVADPRTISRCPQHAARGFYEEIEHPVSGRHPVPALPFRYAGVGRWLRTPAPTLGQHNREILSDWLGLGASAIDGLEAQGVIGTRPAGL